MIKLSLKELNDLYYVVGKMMMLKEENKFIKDEELEVLSDKLREMIDEEYFEKFSV